MSHGVSKERTTYEQVNRGYEATDFRLDAKTENIVTVVEFHPDNLTQDLMSASEGSLASVWSTPEEDEAWKDL